METGVLVLVAEPESQGICDVRSQGRETKNSGMRGALSQNV